MHQKDSLVSSNWYYLGPHQWERLAWQEGSSVPGFTKTLRQQLGVPFSNTLLTSAIFVSSLTYGAQLARKDTRCLIPLYFREAKAAMIVYDITNEETFHRATRWVQVLLQMGPNTIIAFVGNKSDLTSRCVVQPSRGLAYAKENDLLFKETSAVTTHNVNEDLIALVRKLSSITQLNRKTVTTTGEPWSQLTRFTENSLKVAVAALRSHPDFWNYFVHACLSIWSA